MNRLKKKLSLLATRRTEFSRPVILDLSLTPHRVRMKKLFKARQVLHVSDDYLEQLKEYFAFQNPTLVFSQQFPAEFKKYRRSLEKQAPIHCHGRWVYFPWLFTAVHILAEDAFYEVRTMRNRNLITAAEQKKFYNATVGIAGLSVGNSVALAIALQGGAKHFRLSDPDRLSLSNTNRVRAGVENLGLLKVEVTARQIYSLNPFAKIELLPNGLTIKNVQKFFSGPPALDIVIDELDNLAIKYLLREQAKKHRLAVVMGADNGDNAVVDIERYDSKNPPAFFHRRLGPVSFRKLSGLDKFGIGKSITKHIGAENVTERMQESLLEMGRTIVSWPQLGGAALLNGSAVAYCVRKILNNQAVEPNRALISLDEKLKPGYNSREAKKKRLVVAKSFKKIFGL